MIRLYFFCFFFILCSSIFAQDSTGTSDSIKIYYAQAADLSNRLHFSELNFTSLKAFQHYRKYPQILPYAHMGNYGLAFHDYKYKRASLGINGVAPAASLYFWDHHTIRYYQTNRPFTELQYLMGAEAENYLKLFHTQNFGRSLNIAFHYHRVNSEGFYFRQLATQALFNTSLNFKNRDSSYHLEAYFTYNNVENFENAGIALADSVNPNEINADLLAVNLENAENISKNHAYYLHQKLDLSTFISGLNKEIISFEHEFNYKKTYRRYTDQIAEVDSFYTAFYFHATESNDSTFAREYYNMVGISLFSGLISAHYKSRDLRFFQNFLISEDLQSNYFLLKSSATFGKFHYAAYIEKALSGDFEKELNLVSQFAYHFKNKDVLSAQLLYEQYKGDVFLNKYRSNHLFYDNSFKYISNFHPEINYQSHKIHSSISLGANRSINYIYFDTTARPVQHEKELLNPYIRISNELKFLRRFHLNNQILYQQFSDEKLLPLPSLFSSHSFYYENSFFKNAMLFQFGIDFYWIGKYRGYQYFPASNRFYLNNKSNSMGNSTQLDIFVNTRIDKNFKLGLKLENLMGENYDSKMFRIQDYPIPGKAFKLQLSWALLN